MSITIDFYYCTPFIITCLHRSEYVFSFDNAFELHNDIDVLKKMGLDCGIHSGSCSAENLKQAKSILPKAFGDILDGKVVTVSKVSLVPTHFSPPPRNCSIKESSNK